MNKKIRVNAFDMNCVGHIQHGMWTHPRDRSTEYNTIQYWQANSLTTLIAVPLVFLLPRLLVLRKDAEIYEETPGLKTAME
jgi:hypothetical protein